MAPLTQAADFVSRSPDDTRALGRALGRLLVVGDFIGLCGLLGAGKTLFVRGLAEGAGVPPEDVSSPTFAIVQPYEGRLPIYHSDLYRVSDARELYGTGFSDVGRDGATVVEWMDRIPDAAPAEHLLITIRESVGPEERVLHAVAHGARPIALLAAWKTAPI